jgi:hypothetical protein
MLKRFLAITAAAGALGSTLQAVAQEATEMYVPIGQSPGISGKTSVVGTIQALNTAARTLTVVGPAGPQTFAITDKTRIWLDKSAQKQANQYGSLADLQQGRRVEVNPQPAGRAGWIKVQVPGGG